MIRDAKDSTAEKVGFFGGTFDPIHLGHLNLAVELLEHCGLDEVWFCPAQVSPHRLDHQAVAAKHRLEMVQLAIQDHPQFRILTVELDREGASYTTETVEQLREQFPAVKFNLLIGADHLGSFHRWHRADELVAMAPPLVGLRSQADLEKIPGSESLKDALRRGIVETALMDVSATDLRHRLEKKLYCAHLVPQKVLDYIHKNRLYFS